MMSGQNARSGCVIKGFFFDLDGTLVNTYQADYLAYRDAIEEVLGIVIDEADFAQTHGQEMKAKLRWLAPGTTKDQAAAVAAAKKMHYKKYVHLTSLNSSLAAFLAAFSGQGYQMVLVTTAKRDNAESVLQAHRLTDYFTQTVYGEDVQKPKPDPEAYNLALQRSGLLPNEVVVFEDSLSGIQAAEAAHLTVVRVNEFSA